jgi:hypothetical protein
MKQGLSTNLGRALAACLLLTLAAVVFEDYTYEGDADSAARKVCMDEGTRLQLPRL